MAEDYQWLNPACANMSCSSFDGAIGNYGWSTDESGLSFPMKNQTSPSGNMNEIQQMKPLELTDESSSPNHFFMSKNTAFWNPIRGSMFSRPPEVGFLTEPFEEESSFEKATSVKFDSTARETKKISAAEASFKRRRVESPSPYYKVPKEKLGDRITALQQLVSPFGKTDTASVLHEAIHYINFLHEQVSVLSNAYLKNGEAHVQVGGKDLSSRGLYDCLRV